MNDIMSLRPLSGSLLSLQSILFYFSSLVSFFYLLRKPREDIVTSTVWIQEMLLSLVFLVYIIIEPSHRLTR